MAPATRSPVSSETQKSVVFLVDRVVSGMPAERRLSLVASLVELVEGSIAAERDRCVRACRRRSELWRRTALARSPSASGREESRSRANEAAYLADLLDGGGRLLGEPDADDSDA